MRTSRLRYWTCAPDDLKSLLEYLAQAKRIRKTDLQPSGLGGRQSGLKTSTETGSRARSKAFAGWADLLQAGVECGVVKIVNGSKPYWGMRVAAARQAKGICAESCDGVFPLTPALSLGERVAHFRCGKQSRLLSFPLRAARCSLSLGERVGVRGNSAR